MLSTRVPCISDAFIDSLHNPLKILREKLFLIFRSKIKNRIYKNGHNFILQGFWQSRPFISQTLLFKLIEKKHKQKV